MRKIELVNVRGLEANAQSVVYIGRACAGWKGSVLGNPFQIGKDGSREEVIEKYRHWLWARMKEKGVVYDEIMRLAKWYAEGRRIVLGCWCYPQACHGEVVARAIRYYGYFKRPTKPRNAPRPIQSKPAWLRKFHPVSKQLQQIIQTKEGDPC